MNGCVKSVSFTSKLSWMGLGVMDGPRPLLRVSKDPVDPVDPIVRDDQSIHRYISTAQSIRPSRRMNIVVNSY